MFKKSLLVTAIVSMMSGCATTGGFDPVNNKDANTLTPVIQAADMKLENQPSVKYREPLSPYLIYSDNEFQKYFVPVNVNSRNEIPNMLITSNVRLVDYSLHGIMTALTDAAGMSFIIDREVMSQNAQKSFKLRGSLAEVMEQIARAFDVVYDINGNNISIKKRTEFSVQIPPMNKAAKQAIVQTIQQYGGSNIRFNNDETIHYVADFAAKQRIDGYLNMVRESKSLVVYDVYVWDVTLDENKSIDWAMYDKLVMSMKDSTKSMRFTPESSVTMQTNCRENSAIDPTFIQTFLSNQGSVKYYQQPDLMLLSGTSESVSYTKYMDNSVKKQVGRTIVTLDGDYTGGLVRTKLKLSMGTYENSGKPNVTDLSDRMDSENLFSVYPGGAALITGVEAPNIIKGKRSELAVLIKPSVILLDKPANGFFKFQEEQAERACRTEMKERENSITFRKLVLSQSENKAD
jgi:hypothetical protein